MDPPAGSVNRQLATRPRLFPTVQDRLLSTRYVDDNELVERAREGSTEAFGQLVRRHRTAVFRAALAALGSEAEAEEIAQDAFVRAFRTLSTFRGDASFKAWLLTIAWRLALNRRRSVVRRLRRFTGLDVDAWAQVGDSGRTAEEMLLERERADQGKRLIATLPRTLRDALLLSAAGESYREIARTLDIPEGTLKWRVSEARRLLKRSS